MKSRRTFLRCCCSLGAGTAGLHLARLGAVSASAQTTSGYKAIVCVFLFGGNDSNNTVVPLSASGYGAYSSVRRGLAIPQAQLRPITAAGGAAYGLHPQLQLIQTLYNQRKAAVVLNIGMLVAPVTKADISAGAPVPRNLYSHSDQTAQWQAANPMGAAGTGWAGRAADILQFANAGQFPPAVSVNGNSLQLVGSQTRPVSISPGQELGIDSLGDGVVDDARDAAMQKILTFDSGMQLIATGNAIVRAGIQSAQQINDAINNAPPLATQFPNSGLGQQLAQVARVIQARTALGMSRQIFFCGTGGYDNHSNLLGDHNNLLASLNTALTAFYAATQELAVEDSVTTFTESEFNRTFEGNGTAGTDHAWGGHQVVFGGAVRGGDVYGRMPVLQLRGPDDAGDRGLFIPSIALDQYGATIAQWFGVPDPDLDVVFPNLRNFATRNLGFMA
jgi:uncharacterized protein (DUF1501 family)